MATNKLKQIINSNSQNNVLQKGQLHALKELNKKLTTENAIITQADKGKMIVILNSNEYSEKVHFFLTANNFNILTKDLTEKFHNVVHRTMQKSNLIIDKKQIKFLTQKKASLPTLKAQLKLHKTYPNTSSNQQQNSTSIQISKILNQDIRSIHLVK